MELIFEVKTKEDLDKLVAQNILIRRLEKLLKRSAVQKLIKRLHDHNPKIPIP